MSNRNFLHQNNKWTIMDIETFKKMSASMIDKTIKENAKKRVKKNEQV